MPRPRLRPAGRPAKAKPSGGSRPAFESVNKPMPTVEEFGHCMRALAAGTGLRTQANTGTMMKRCPLPREHGGVQPLIRRAGAEAEPDQGGSSDVRRGNAASAAHFPREPGTVPVDRLGERRVQREGR